MNPTSLRTEDQRLAGRVAAARGLEHCDLVLRNLKLVNVCSGEIYPSEVAIAQGRVVGLGEGYQGRQECDLGGMHVLPGLIDGHMHVESTMLVPAQFASVAVPHGTTSVIVDPHEFANVLGLEGILYLLNSSAGLPLSMYVMLPSCVPASAFERPRQSITAADLEPLLSHPLVLGLAEMMDVDAVLNGDPVALAKLAACQRSHGLVDGHAPGLSGKDLNGYVAAGIYSDHESTTVAEALEKLRLGMWLMLREGSAARNLRDLLPLLNSVKTNRVFFVTDDRDPVDLTVRGHVDSMVRMAIESGVDPVDAVRMGTLNTATYFGLRDRGMLAPGCWADLLVVDDLRGFQATRVFKEGIEVAREGKPLFRTAARDDGPMGRVNLGAVRQEDLVIRAQFDRVSVIGVADGQITTEHLVEAAPVADGLIVSDPQRDLLKIAVIDRHHGSGRVCLGLIRGLGLQRGALASTVAHDAHNLVVVGCSDADMLLAARTLEELGGGFSVVADAKVLATVPLPVAGLVSQMTAHQVAAQLERLDRAALELGCRISHPCMTLSFVSLSVIPSLKLTDSGLLEVASAHLLPLGMVANGPSALTSAASPSGQ